jgi:hypothetical protein
VSKTKSEIGVLALQALQAVEGDATPDSNDTTVIEAAYDMVYARLRTRHLVSWASTGSVPEECVNPVVSLVAESRISYFQPPPDAAADIRFKASQAFGDLTEVLAMDYVPDEYKGEYL